MRSVSPYRAPANSAILLVDDNRDGNLARRSVLEELGYKVVPAASGSEALELLDRERFDLVITDYRMLPVDGVELIKTLRERGFTRPVILLTGFAQNLGLHPETTGADVVIQKSSNEIVTLIRHIKRLVNAPRKPAASQTKRSSSRAQSK
ncbi:MAG: response regulator [Acidobacteriota bacterium]|nr:response regulator [Acidobacteriota bacterium]